MIVAGVRAQARRRLRDVSGMPRVEIRFDGVSRGAKQAAAETRGAIASVGDQAAKDERRVSRFGSTIRSSLMLGAKAAAGGVGLLAGAVAFAGFKFDDLKQRANIAFTTMLGSGQKAQAFLAQLQKFAASTPFEFPQLIQTSQRLLAMGFNAKQVVPTLTAIGDAVAGLGGSPEIMDRVTTALGQIQAKGKVASEEMLQLTESGIPAWQMLADKIGVSVPRAMELVQARAVDSNVAIAALTEGMEKRFGGMMEKQSHTFGGLLSTVKDTFTQLSGTVMAPFFEMATNGLQSIVDYTSRPAFTDGVKRFGAALQVWVGKTSQQVRDFLVKHWGDIKSVIRTAWDVVKLGVKIFEDVVRASDKVAHALGGWRPTVIALGTAWVAYKGFMTAAMVATRIQAAITAGTIRATLISTGIGALVVAAGIAVGLIIAHWSKIRAWIIQFGRWISDHAKLLLAVPMIGTALFIAVEVVKHFQTIKKAVVTIAKAIVSTFSSVFNWLVKTAITVALQVVEPFSHLPGKLGGWARDAKDALHAQLDAMHKDATGYGAATGDAWGKGYYNAASGWLTAAGGLTAGMTGGAGAKAGAGAGAGVKGGLSNAGTRFGVVTTAQSQLGIPYQWGGAAVLGHSTDCSGLVQAVFRKNGINLPRTTYEQWNAGRAVSVGELQPGDLVFFHMGAKGPEHVGIYVGGDRFLEDPHTGAAVRYSKLSTYPGYAGARRVIAEDSKTAGKPGGRAPGDAAPKASATASTFAPPTDELFGVTDAQLSGTLTGGASKKAASTAKTRAKAVAIIRDQVAELAAEYGKLPPAAQRIVAPKMAALRDELAHVSDDRTLAKARRGLSELKAAINGELSLQKSVQIVRDEAAKVADAIGLLPAAARSEIAPKMEALRKELATVTSTRDLTRAKADLQKIRDAVKAAIDAMTEDVKRKRDAFSQAFGSVADKALQVFDAKTAKLVAAARIQFEGITLGEGDLTPEERALADFQAQRALDEQAKRRAEDVAARDALLVESADETADERAKRLLELAAAEEKIRQDDADDQERALQAAAEASRKAADVALDLERARIDDERALIRERMAGRLQAIQTAFANEQITAEEAQRQLLAVLADPQYATDFSSVGALIGNAFATGFTDALTAVRNAVNDLRASVDALGRATGTSSGLPTIGDANATDVVSVDTGIGGIIRVSQAYAQAHGVTVAGIAADAGRWTAIANAYAKRRAGGGKIPGQYVGMEDTVLTRLSPGENVIDRRLNAALERELLGGGRAGTLAGARIYVLGTTEREVAAALKRIVDGAPETPGYRSVQ